MFSNPPLPASMNRSRQLEIVVAVTPCRRAASATEISPCDTANTTRNRSSTGTVRPGFCDLLMTAILPGTQTRGP